MIRLIFFLFQQCRHIATGGADEGDETFFLQGALHGINNDRFAFNNKDGGFHGK